ncbi:MAG: multidrug ABC transporter ATPase [Solibacillus sp.]|uniref:multidrug ABC transporter ATPase n=1 Tax=unclassified Solibacillus TaxID=2637870 RepID=UPI0030F90ABA
MTNRDEIVNGNMANSLDELKLLGKQMENMRDEQQLEETARIADPQQFDDEELLEKTKKKKEK